MRLLIFGRNGQVATELQRLGAAAGHALTVLDRDAADLSRPEDCAAAISDAEAEAIINAAAWTAVDKAEADEPAAALVNGAAPGAMARQAAEIGVPFLHVSTDYVFDGGGDRPWREDDQVAPLNAYGRTKLAGEEAVRAAGGSHAILRTSWVFSAHGANFVKTMLRLAESRDRLTVVDDQIGGPTPADSIAAALLTMASGMVSGAVPGASPGAASGTTPGTVGGTYHLGGQPPVSWAGFAREIFAQAGREVTVEGIPTSDYPTPAPRPLNSRLDCAKLTSDFGITPPDWKDGLARVLRDLGHV